MYASIFCFFSTSLTDMIYTHTDTISMYMNLLYTCGCYWLPAFSTCQASKSRLQPHPGLDLGELEIFLCWKLWTMGLLWPLICWTFGRWMFGKNPPPNIQRSSPISLWCEGCSELHQQQGGAALWIYRRVQGWARWLDPVDVDDCPVIRREMGRWKFQCKELWNDDSCGSGEVTTLLQVDFWIFLGFSELLKMDRWWNNWSHKKLWNCQFRHQVKGQPCVWCGGGPGPYDVQMKWTLEWSNAKGSTCPMIENLQISIFEF